MAVDLLGSMSQRQLPTTVRDDNNGTHAHYVEYEDYVEHSERQVRDHSTRTRALALFTPDFERNFIPAKELPTVQLFRKQIDELGWGGSYWDNSMVAYRYLVARDLDLSKAIAMFQADMEWRKSKNLTNLVDTVEYGLVPGHLVQLQLEEFAAIRSFRRLCFHKTDRDGRPIAYDCVGTITTKGLSKITTIDRFLEYVVWFQEATIALRLPAASLKAGKLVTKIVVVMDLSGFKMSNFNADFRALLKRMAAIGADHYPETMHRTYVVNAPSFFRVIWAFVKPILPPRVINAVVICGGQRDYLPRLLRDVCDKTDLPVHLGGDDTTCTFTREVGPWSDSLPPHDTVGWQPQQQQQQPPSPPPLDEEDFV